jgi:hypothetical protein
MIRDVRDNQLLDCRGRPIGRVDGIVAAYAPGCQPRLVAIEVGIPAALRRLNRRLGDAVARWVERHGPRAPATHRIPWAAMTQVGIDITLAIDADETPLLDWERWIRRHVVDHLPFAERS